MLEYEAENEVVRGSIDIEKQDSEMGSTPQGNSSFAGIAFEIINRSANPVVVGGGLFGCYFNFYWDYDLYLWKCEIPSS